MAYYHLPDFFAYWTPALAWGLLSVCGAIWNVTWGCYILARLGNKRARCAMSRHVWSLDTEPITTGTGMTVFLKIHCLMCEERIDFTLRTQLQPHAGGLEVLYSLLPTITGDRDA